MSTRITSSTQDRLVITARHAAATGNLTVRSCLGRLLAHARFLPKNAPGGT